MLLFRAILPTRQDGVRNCNKDHWTKAVSGYLGNVCPYSSSFRCQNPRSKTHQTLGVGYCKTSPVYVFHNHSCSNTCSSHPSCSICRLLAEHLRKVDKYMTNIIVLPVDHSWAQHGEYPLICGFSLFKTLLRKEKGLIALVKFSYYDPADCNRLTTFWLTTFDSKIVGCVCRFMDWLAEETERAGEGEGEARGRRRRGMFQERILLLCNVWLM